MSGYAKIDRRTNTIIHARVPVYKRINIIHSYIKDIVNDNANAMPDTKFDFWISVQGGCEELR
jgi:hypothetical protein